MCEIIEKVMYVSFKPVPAEAAKKGERKENGNEVNGSNAGKRKKGESTERG